MATAVDIQTKSAHPSTPPLIRMAGGEDVDLQMIANLPIAPATIEMQATIASEMPPLQQAQQVPPTGIVAPAAATDEQHVSGTLQQLYEQQQIFAYHAQQAQQAHLNYARLARASGSTAGTDTLLGQVQRLGSLRDAMMSMHRGAAVTGPPGVVPPVAPAGEKRSAESELGQQGADKRQRVEPDGGPSSFVIDVVQPQSPAAELPIYTDDATGLGLPVPASEVRSTSRLALVRLPFSRSPIGNIHAGLARRLEVLR
jgi:hypothetical protein